MGTHSCPGIKSSPVNAYGIDRCKTLAGIYCLTAGSAGCTQPHCRSSFPLDSQPGYTWRLGAGRVTRSLRLTDGSPSRRKKMSTTSLPRVHPDPKGYCALFHQSIYALKLSCFYLPADFFFFVKKAPHLRSQATVMMVGVSRSTMFPPQDQQRSTIFSFIRVLLSEFSESKSAADLLLPTGREFGEPGAPTWAGRACP